MPLYNGNYVAPVWVNGVPPTIGETELDIISEVLQGAQVLKGSGAPTSQTAGIVGQKYADTSTTPPTIYQCFGASGGVYTWGTAGNVNVNLAQEYDSTIPYAEGAYCLHGGLLYQANTDIATAEAWNSAHWTQVRAADALQAHVQDQANPHNVTAAQIGLGNVDNVLQYSTDNPAVKLGTVSLTAAWSGSGGVYTQTITVTGATVTENSHVELQFTSAQADTLAGSGIGNIYVENNSGTLTAIAVGGRPTAMTVQCTVEEMQIIKAYLTFVGNDSFTLQTDGNEKKWDNIMESSTDGVTWTVWDGTTVLSSGASNSLYLRGTGNIRVSNTTPGTTGFSFGGAATRISCTGNIETLRDYNSVVAGESFPYPPNFSNLFSGCTQLTTTPTFPDVTPQIYGYEYMFYGCTQLASSPELPATTLSIGCYRYMFANCKQLTTSPALPATTVYRDCYYGMFSGCTQLASIPELPATILKEACYSWMFAYCSSIKISESQGGEYTNSYRIPTTGAGTDATNALRFMFNSTGGSFTGTPTINTTYYTSNAVVPAT